MTVIPPPADVIIIESKILPRALLLLCCLLIVTTTIDFSFPLLFRKSRVLVDFDDFYIVGKMFWNGSLASAYNFESMLKAQLQFTKNQSFLPWTYPPQFDFISAALALLPEGLSYFSFITVTFASYLLVLRCLAKEYFGIVIAATMPALFITIKCGQNGFLTGALVGLFCLAFLRSRKRAGLPLGLMVIKPHLAVGMTLLALFNKRWNVLFISALVVVLTSLLTTMAFSYHIWPAFIDGGKESARFLKAGFYPFFRMISIYAVCVTFGFSPVAALSIQCIVALAACSSIYYAYSKNWNAEHITGISILASLLVSPYSYDYDLPIFGVALALLIPGIIAGTSRLEKTVLFGCSWLTCGWGLGQYYFVKDKSPQTSLAALHDQQPYSVAGLCLLAIFLMVFKIIATAKDNETKNL